MKLYHALIALGMLGFGGAAYISPNSSAIDAARQLHSQGLNILDFYIALKDLYLSHGFEYGNPFNAAIVGQAKISDEVWKQIRYGIEQTRLEIRSGEVGLGKLENLIKLNSPEALTFELWIKNMAALITNFAKNPKDVAYSIRDIGKYLIDEQLTRTDYQNGTYLLTKVSSWIAAQFPPSEEPKLDQNSLFTNNIIILHHVFGPEKFDAIADILESFPFKTDCVEEPDKEMVAFFTDLKRIPGIIIDADQTEKVLLASRAGFRNYTATDGSLTVIDRLVLNDLGSKFTIPALQGSTTSSSPRYTKSSEAIQQDIGALSFKESFVSGSVKAMQAGLTMADIKEALVALAKLLNNLKSKEAVLQKLGEIEAALQVKNWKYSLEYLQDLTFRLPDDSIKILNSYLALEQSPDVMLFPETQFTDLELMQKLFVALNNIPPQGVVNFLSLAIEPYTARSAFPALDLMSAFGGITGDDDDQRSALLADLQMILNWTNATNNATSYQEFVKTLLDVSNSTRDGRWSDFYAALQDLSKLFDVLPKHRDASLAPFKNLEQSMSLIEVLQGMRMLLDHFPEKLEFIRSFLELEDPVANLEALGIKGELLEAWTHSTRSIDALTDLLKASGSRANLGTLLGYHGVWTTNREDTNDSLEKIKNIIQFMQMDGRFYGNPQRNRNKGRKNLEQLEKLFPLDNIKWFHF